MSIYGLRISSIIIVLFFISIFGGDSAKATSVGISAYIPSEFTISLESSEVYLQTPAEGIYGNWWYALPIHIDTSVSIDIFAQDFIYPEGYLVDENGINSLINPLYVGWGDTASPDTPTEPFHDTYVYLDYMDPGTVDRYLHFTQWFDYSDIPGNYKKTITITATPRGDE